MTLPAWPSDLPRPMRDSWEAQPQEARVRRVAERGPPGYRRSFSSVARFVAMTIDVTRHEKSLFDIFHAETTRHGTLPFTMPDPTTDGWALLDSAGDPILTDAGAPILLAKSWTCLFGQEAPRERVYGVRFVISFPIVVMP